LEALFFNRIPLWIMDLRGRNFLELTDLSKSELKGLIELATELKADSGPRDDLRGRTLAMLFAKTSTRTRVSFEVAMYHLGGHALNLKWEETNFVKGDISDEAKVLSRYCDGLMARLFSHDDMRAIGEASERPVINGMDDDHHPCQALADIMTIVENKDDLRGLKLAWIGDGTNVFVSLSQAARLLGMKVTIAVPPGYEPRIETGAEILRQPAEAAAGADVLVTDTWVSLGQESEKKKRLGDFRGYTIDSELMKLAAPDSIVLHCLPAQRGYEISSEVLDSPQCLAFDEAENRLHTTKALLLSLL
jgi:ornithine carbamoyltransferase